MVFTHQRRSMGSGCWQSGELRFQTNVWDMELATAPPGKAKDRGDKGGMAAEVEEVWCDTCPTYL